MNVCYHMAVTLFKVKFISITIFRNKIFELVPVIERNSLLEQVSGLVLFRPVTSALFFWALVSPVSEPSTGKTSIGWFCFGKSGPPR